MRILGIDQSYTSSGIIVLEDGEVAHSEIIKSPKAMDIYDRAAYIASTIVSIVNLYKPDLVGLEGLAFGMRGNATRDLAGLQFIIIKELRDAGVNTEIISPKTVKLFATKNGKAKKPDMVAALPEKVVERFTSMNAKKTTGLYDLTDAYWIAKTAENKKQ